MKCQHCGNLIREGLKFCEHCGQPLIIGEADQQDQMRTDKNICPKCNFENRIGLRFCEQCGGQLPEEEKILETVNCPECHHENRLGVKFCESCGNKLITNKTTHDSAKSLSTAGKPNSSLTPEPSKQKSMKSLLFENKFRTAFFSLLAIILILGGGLLINKISVRFTRREAQKLANSVVYSTYPEFSGIEPFVEHSKEGGQHFSTYSYSNDFYGNLPTGEQVEFSRFVVIRVNRSNGRYVFINAY